MSRTCWYLLREMYNVLSLVLAVISKDMSVREGQAANTYMSNIEEWLDDLK